MQLYLYNINAFTKSVMLQLYFNIKIKIYVTLWSAPLPLLSEEFVVRTWLNVPRFGTISYRPLRISESTSLFGRFPGFARLSFWHGQNWSSNLCNRYIINQFLPCSRHTLSALQRPAVEICVGDWLLMIWRIIRNT